MNDFDWIRHLFIDADQPSADNHDKKRGCRGSKKDPRAVGQRETVVLGDNIHSKTNASSEEYQFVER